MPWVRMSVSLHESLCVSWNESQLFDEIFLEFTGSGKAVSKLHLYTHVQLDEAKEKIVT